MDYWEAEGALRRIKYKPRYELSWMLYGDELLKVWWEFERPDCYNPDEMGVGISGPEWVYLPEVDNAEQLVRKVFGMTLRLEEHETREFFLVDGARVFDPHVQLMQKDEHS